MSGVLHGFPVVGDDYGHVDGFWRGYVGRDKQSFPLNSLKCCAAPSFPILTLAEIKEAIDYKTANKLWLTDRCDRAGLTVKYQESTLFCWINAPTHGMEACYVMQGGTKKVLSAAAAGGQINGWRNQGGSGIEGVKFLAETGVPTEDIFPRNAINPRYLTSEAQANQSLHKIVSYTDIDPDDKLTIWSAIVADFGVTVGVPAWTHEVLLTFLVKGSSGDPVEGFDNSWDTTWGTNGRGVLGGAKRHFDEAGSIQVVTPSVA